MFRKLLICPFFGPLPPFFENWKSSVETLKPYGYDVLVTTDLDAFNDRVEKKLGFRTPIVPGTGKLWDYRAAFGVLFEEELKGYEFWGHTDFDVVYGRVDRYVTEEMLEKIDIYSDEENYIGGHFTLYRNSDRVNSLFRSCEAWKSLMLDPAPNGWVEKEFTLSAERSGLAVYLKKNQATRDNQGLALEEDGTLRQHGNEVMLAHFKDQKRWPL